MTLAEASVGDSATVAAPLKILVVSSYRRPCGIAQYLEYLEGPLRNSAEGEIEIAALPVDLFRGTSSFAKRAAKAEFAQILKRAAQADIFNIQFGPGLYGLSPLAIWRRLGTLLNASKRVVIPYHTVPPIADSLSWSWRSAKAHLAFVRSQYVFGCLFSAVHRRPGKFHHIVHTKREARNFELLGIPSDTISAAPLSFVAQQEREKHDSATDAVWLRQRWQLPGNAKLIGVFGFLNEYKGIEIAIRSLRRLPEDCHLMIVGGVHPESMPRGRAQHPYIRQLLAEISGEGRGELEKVVSQGADGLLRAASAAAAHLSSQPAHSLADRVHFCGAPSNTEFNRHISGCDIVVLPYAEVGQTSSGPASLGLDILKPVICSRTHCFRELDRYEPGILSFFRNWQLRGTRPENYTWGCGHAKPRYCPSTLHRKAQYRDAAIEDVGQLLRCRRIGWNSAAKV